MSFVFRINQNGNIRNLMRDLFFELIETNGKILPPGLFFAFTDFQANDRDLQSSSKANARMCARRATDRDPASVMPDKRKYVIFVFFANLILFELISPFSYVSRSTLVDNDSARCTYLHSCRQSLSYLCWLSTNARSA